LSVLPQKTFEGVGEIQEGRGKVQEAEKSLRNGRNWTTGRKVEEEYVRRGNALTSVLLL